MKIEQLSHFEWFNDRLSEKAMKALKFMEEDGGWGHGKGKTILSDGEIYLLGWVPVTFSEAEAICERNSTLLEFLSECKYISATTYLGCPHCALNENEYYDCADCAWSPLLSRCITSSSPCLEQTFGGYRLSETGVEYGHGHERVSLSDGNSRPVSPSVTAVFLAAHVEWALMHIKGEFTPVNFPFRAWTDSKRKRWKSRARLAIRSRAKEILEGGSGR